MTEAQRLHHEAFAKPRDQRSAEYMLGCLHVLESKTSGTKHTCPYPIGTAQADAYFSGCSEGVHIFNYKEKS